MKKLFFLLLLLPSLTFAQNNIKPNQLWHLSNESNGINADRAYEFLKDKTSREIIVAVIDGGTDINHPDLKGKIWVNTKEITGNGKDDDNNGYIDDINGWNFIGGPNGKNVAYDTKEETRIYRELRSNPNADVHGYKIADVKPVIDKEIKFAKSQMPALQLMTKNLDSISIALNTENPTKDEIEAYQPNSRVQGFLKTQILE